MLVHLLHDGVVKVLGISEVNVYIVTYDQVVIVQMRRTSQVGGRVGRVEHEIGEESLSRFEGTGE